MRARLSIDTVHASLERFQQGGIAAIRGKRSYPGRALKLAPNELKTVAAMAGAMAPLVPEQLRAYIEAAFGVRYATQGLLNMLKTQLGIVYTASASRPPAPASPSQT